MNLSISAYLSAEPVKINKKLSNDERLFSLSSVTSPASKRDEKRQGQAPKEESNKRKKVDDAVYDGKTSSKKK